MPTEIMFRQYLTLAVRHLKAQPGYTLLNVFGLAAGMAMCLLITLYISEELSFDTFHENADRIQVVTLAGDMLGSTVNTPYPLGTTLRETVPGVQAVTRTQGAREQRVQVDADREEMRLRVLETDASFFRVFDGFTVSGAPAETVLQPPGSAVIRADVAKKHFGDASPVGETLTIRGDGDDRLYTIRGVTDIPKNSTIEFDVAVTMPDATPAQEEQWGLLSYKTYALMETSLAPAEMNERLALVKDAFPSYLPASANAVALPDYYFSEYNRVQGFRGSVRYLYVFGACALLVLLIAGINYTNLRTVQAAQRAREVGVRKAIGAHQGQLTTQFIGEAFLISVGSAGISVLLAASVLPLFNRLFGTELALSSVSLAQLSGAAAIIVAVTTLASGFYPSLVMSRFQPARVLRASSSQRSGGAGWFQKGLVVTQFAASVGLIFGTLVIYQQLQFVQTKTLGFDGEQVLTAELGRIPADRMASIRDEVRRHPGVEAATIGAAMPGAVSVYYSAPLERLSDDAVTSSEDETARIARLEADAAYTETLGLEVVAGRGFSEDQDVGGAKKYLLNETAAQTMGWTAEEAIGKPFLLSSTPDGREPGEVVGVVRDFHVSSLRDEIGNVALELSPSLSGSGRLAARLRPESIREAREHVASVLAEAGIPAGANLEFLDDTFNAMYRSETRIAQIFSIFSGIAILIACMGLFGLAAFTIEQRKKEIGIRKVLGASVSQIVGIVFRTYSGIVAVAVVVGLPLAYYLVGAWLQEFAYRVDIGAAVFVSAAVVALGVATVSVGYHAISASRMDPAHSLRSE